MNPSRRGCVYYLAIFLSWYSVCYMPCTTFALLINVENLCVGYQLSLQTLGPRILEQYYSLQPGMRYSSPLSVPFGYVLLRRACRCSYSAWWVSDLWYILIYLIQFSVVLVHSLKAITRMMVSNWFLRLPVHPRRHAASLSFETLSPEAVVSLYIPT